MGKFLFSSFSFFLSGDALTTSFFKRRDLHVIGRLMIARYFRLTFPILFSALVAYLVMVAGWNYAHQASSRIEGSWLVEFLHFDPSLFTVFKFSLYKVYFAWNMGWNYNPFLWTMSFELFGSMLVFAATFLINSVRYEKSALTLLALVTLVVEPTYSLFLFGMLAGLVRREGTLNAIISGKYTMIPTLIALILVSLFTFARSSQDVFLGTTLQSLVQNGRSKVVWTVLFMTSIYCSRPLLLFFQNRVSVFLGQVSFPIFVFQFVVLCSFTSFLILVAAESLSNPLVVLGISSTSILLSLVVAMLFRPVEKAYLSWLNRFVEKKLMKSTP